ncbi:MAG: hypothetical protein SWY16_22615 [Cyanobacteriota bacterium]|nr:hypothetical protein [Cyanobacteriota bacterium]
MTRRRGDAERRGDEGDKGDEGDEGDEGDKEDDYSINILRSLSPRLRVPPSPRHLPPVPHSLISPGFR